MGMLKSIGLENYKCFKDPTTIDIAPLTVLCGVNSSGKSSILKSLLMLKQSYENTSSSNSITLNGKYLNEGSIQNIISKDCGKRVTISYISVLPAVPKFSKNNFDKIDRDEIAAYNELRKIFEIKDKLPKITIKVTLEIIPKTIDSPINVINKYYVEVAIEGKSTLEILLDKVPDKTNRDYNIRLKNFIDVEETDISLPGCVCYFEGLRVANIFINSTNKYYKIGITQNICTIIRHAISVLAGIKHVSPLRKEPSRFYVYTDDSLNTGLAGENTIQVIQNAAKLSTSFLEPPVNDEFVFHSKYKGAYDFLQMWLDYLGLGKIETRNIEELLKAQLDGFNIADVGFGVSQVLPILVEGILLNGRQTLLIEQPEIHLHPKAQMAMADFLIASAYKSKNLIVETHSDHIINRILRRVLEHPESDLGKFVKIYYVEDGNIQPIQIDRVHGFVDAPPEFFTQFSSETERIFQVSMQNLRRG